MMIIIYINLQKEKVIQREKKFASMQNVKKSKAFQY